MPLHCPDAMPVTRSLPLVAAAVIALILSGCGGRSELPDFASMQDVRRMKQAFYAYLEPVVAEQNARILAQREDLAAIRARLAAGDDPGWFQRRRLRALADEYELDWEGGDPAEIASRLWRRVDTIPAELALAQAAKESGWGRSPFAVEINMNPAVAWCRRVAPPAPPTR